MGLIVQKFGGTSIADRICINNIANIIKRRISEGNQVVTVVSAQGDDTDRLLAKAKEIAPNPDLRELDALLTTGEQVSASLLAIALIDMGIPAVSLNGKQAGILTNNFYGNAEILEIDTTAIREFLNDKKTVVVTGFQGSNREGEILSLGRGGSDTSAVALAAALNADSCRIYKDVDGIYSSDPRKDLNAKKIDRLSYEQMLEIADAGSGVLQRKCIEIAQKNKIKLQILSSFHPLEGTIIGD